MIKKLVMSLGLTTGWLKKVAFAKSIRAIQVERLKIRSYSLNEADILLPDVVKLQLGLALLVDYETPISEQCRKLGIKNSLDSNYHKDQHLKPQGRWGWIYEVKDSEKFGRKNNRRGLMTVEGLALYRENHDILKDRYVDLSGSRYGRFGDGVPVLCLRDGLPSLSSFWDVVSGPEWGSASTLVLEP